MDEEATYERASLNLEMVLNEEKSELIDEWTKIPKIWDAVRHKCDSTSDRKLYFNLVNYPLPKVNGLPVS